MPDTTVDQIIIRMYHTGSVGDCFLLLFKKGTHTSFSMLIDCGGYKTKKELIRKAVQDIKDSINDNTIDLVVATHEHEDHLSGFNQARDLFDDITFRQVWMSWAENDKDPLAQQLFKEKGKKIKTLQAAISAGLTAIKKQAKSLSNNKPGLERSLGLRKKNFDYSMALLDFADEKSVTGTSGRLKINDAVKFLKTRIKSVKGYKKPGQVIENLDGAEGIRFFILGPPYDDDLQGIKDDLDHDEMYALRKKLGLSENSMHLSALLSENENAKKLPSPFNKVHHLTGAAKKTYLTEGYDKPVNRWRQIEYDWLDSANELAIALTDYVNNTSLAMAIEIKSTGKVLLFPADAQSGNWKSWHDEKVEKALKKNGGRTATELLEKTIFYKVGHHGSHNGTASLSGLEKMKERKIMAFLPLVIDKVPDAWGGSDNFPAKGLYKKLIEKTNGAIIRTDEGLIKDSKASQLRKGIYSAAEVKKMKEASKNPLYHEWVINV